MSKEILWPESSALTAARYSIDVRPDNHALAKFGHTVWPESRIFGEARYGHTIQPQNRSLLRPVPFDPRDQNPSALGKSLSWGISTKAAPNRSRHNGGNPAGVRLPVSSRELQEPCAQVGRRASRRAAIDDTTLPIAAGIEAALMQRAREEAAQAQGEARATPATRREGKISPVRARGKPRCM